MSFPRFTIFVDTETEPVQLTVGEIEQTFMLGCSTFVDYQGHYPIEELDFQCMDDFWNQVIKHTNAQNTLYVIAHNMGFDFRILKGFTQLEAAGFYCHNLLFERGRTFSTFRDYDPAKREQLKKENPDYIKNVRTIVFLDTMNWFDRSLAELGDLMGVPKLRFPGYESSLNDWFMYCRQDVNVMMVFFERFVAFLKENELGSFGITVAKQALNAFKYKYNKTKVIVHTEKKVIDLERAGYFGGRVEAFRIGTLPREPYFYLDINSMYPYVMANYNYPVECIANRKILIGPGIKKLMCGKVQIARITTEVKDQCVPVRVNRRDWIEQQAAGMIHHECPKHVIDKQLIFPVGRITTVLCQPELDLLTRLGYPYQIHEVNLYRHAPLFRHFVESLYKLKVQFTREKNTAYRTFVKLLMNSLYGKFGQRNVDWISLGKVNGNITGVDSIIDAKTGKTVKEKSINGQLFQSDRQVEGFDSMVAIAAFVTSYARVYLYDLRVKAGIENVFYMDTDSLIVNQDGYGRLEELLHPEELGMLALEQQSEIVTINGLKDYRFGTVNKLKGVGKKAWKDYDGNHIVDCWSSVNRQIRDHEPERVIIRQVKKEIQNIYRKGDVQPDGSVQPFLF